MKNLTPTILSILLISFVFLISCSKDDEVVVEEDTFEIIYTEWLVAEYISENPSASTFMAVTLENEIDFEKVIIMVYGKYQSESITPLPIIRGNQYYSFRLIELDNPDNIVSIEAKSINNTNVLFDEFSHFRIVIIPFELMGNNEINLNDYAEIEEIFNIEN